MILLVFPSLRALPDGEGKVLCEVCGGLVEGLRPVGVGVDMAAAALDGDLGHGVLQAAFGVDEDAVGVAEAAGLGAGGRRGG